jgi:hypothetical protein
LDSPSTILAAFFAIGGMILQIHPNELRAMERTSVRAISLGP